MALNILVINRDEDLCAVICRFLRSEGHLAISCSGEKKHLQHSLEERPDLIVIEVAMPELAAIEIINGLHRGTATKNIPVIVISDFPELELELLHVFDFICKPIDLGRLREDIGLLASGARSRGAAVKSTPLTNEEHEKFHDFLIRYSGLHFERRNIRVLERGLESRMTALRIGSFNDYYEYLCQNMERRQELQKLLQLLTVGETFFFRYHAHFEALRSVVLPQLVSTAQQKQLRIWSAGCSTGEEPYSLAITIMESIPHWKQLDIKIIATDINNRSLSRAREGVYNAWKLRVTEKSCLAKYFKQIGESYVVRDEVKALVEFSYFNLQSPPPSTGETFDIIFCRNVMIYFTTATTKKLVENFAVSLKPGGYLFLGHSETLSYISTKFERHLHDGGFYYRKKGEQPGKPVEKPALPAATVKVGRPSQPSAAALRTSPPEPELGPEVMFVKGMNLLQQGDLPAAAAMFEKLLRIQPDHAGAILAQSRLHIAGGRIVEALACCNRALTCNDLLPDGYFLRGLLYEMLEQENEAMDEYRKAILLQMNFVMPHYQLGKLCFRCGDRKSGLRELKNSLKILEKCRRETVIPLSGGLSREVFIGQLREEIQRVEAVIAEESAQSN
jgi:chemotaxis protein methyltransferase CheR